MGCSIWSQLVQDFIQTASIEFLISILTLEEAHVLLHGGVVGVHNAEHPVDGVILFLCRRLLVVLDLPDKLLLLLLSTLLSRLSSLASTEPAESSSRTPFGRSHLHIMCKEEPHIPIFIPEELCLHL